MTRIRVGPAISRRNQTHFSESEIQHGACCLANVLAQLRPHENNDRGDRCHRSFLLSSRWTSRGDRIARRSEQDPPTRFLPTSRGFNSLACTTFRNGNGLLTHNPFPPSQQLFKNFH